MFKLKYFLDSIGGDDKHPLNKLKQSGINMVDLMMWLVIAALLLTSAIQGVAYYKQSAYIYQLKSAVDVAASRVMALATNDGSVDPDDLDTVVAEENANRPNDGITLTVDTISYTASAPHDTSYGIARASFITAATTVPSGETAYVRASHDDVTKSDVIYLFEDIASKKTGIHVVPKGGIGGGGSSDTTAPETNTDPTTTEPTTEPTTDPSASPEPSTEPTVSPSPETTTEPTTEPSPAPTVEAAPPADYNAPSATIVQSSYYPKWFNHAYANSMTTPSHRFGFNVSGSTSVDNYSVEYSGGSNIGVVSRVANYTTSGGITWYVDVAPSAEGYKTGVGNITVKVTNLSTSEVSYKTWNITVSDAQITSSVYYPDWYKNRWISSMTSNSVRFGGSIGNAALSDFTVTFTGGENIGAVPMTMSYATSSGITWYTDVSPGSEGFKTGVGTITMTATHNATGAVVKKDFTLDVGEASISPSTYYPNWYKNQYATVGQTGSERVGGSIGNAALSDFTVTFSGGDSVNADVSATQYTTSAGITWYADVTPRTGGFTAGVSTITMTATHNATGAVVKKDFTVTVQ